MYKVPKFHTTSIEENESVEGESIEHKTERIVNNGEKIKDGAPLIYTERKDGVMAGYNIKTDRFEVALDGMDAIQRSKTARRENKAKELEGKVIDLNGGAESTQGTDN